MTDEQEERILRLTKAQWVVIIRPFIHHGKAGLWCDDKWTKGAGQPLHWEQMEIAPQHTDAEYDELKAKLDEKLWHARMEGREDIQKELMVLQTVCGELRVELAQLKKDRDSK